MILCTHFFSGVSVRSNPFIFGMSATLTCTSDAPATKIEWLDSEERVVARVTSMNWLDLIFNPVNDSIHNSVYTCRVTRGEEMVAEQTITVDVTGKVVVCVW